MRGAEGGGHPFGQRRLVLGGPGVLVEGERDGAQIGPRRARGEGCDGRRIEPGREEDADRHVRHQVVADAVGQHVAQLGRARRLAFARAGHGLRNGEEALGWLGAMVVDPLGGPGRQGADIGVEGVRVGHVAPQEEAHVAGRRGPLTRVPARAQRLHLRGDAEAGAIVGGVERLDAEGVARQQHAGPGRVPDDEGVHAAQVAHHVRPVALVEVEQHLRVRVGAEFVTLLGQAVAQGHEVVDLAVEGDDEGVLAMGHGLVAGGRRIDDREPPVAEADPAVGGQPVTKIVGAADGHRVPDRRQLRLLDRRGMGAVGQDRDDAAHYFRATARKLRLRMAPRPVSPVSAAI